MVVAQEIPEPDAVIAEIDAGARRRFIYHHRMRFLFMGMAAFCFVTCLISAALSLDFYVLLVGIIALLTTSVTVNERSPALTFLAIHPSITYVFTTMLLAVSTNDISLDRMSNAHLSFEIVLLYQLAVFFAYSAFSVIRRSVPKRGPATVFAINPLPVAIWMGVLLLLLALSKFAEFGQSVGPIIIPVIIAIAQSQVGRRSAVRPNYTFLAIFAFSLTIVSFLANQRTYMFCVILAMFMVVLYWARRVLTIPNVLVVCMGAVLLNAVTISFIRARPDDTLHVSASQITRDTMSYMFSSETWAAALTGEDLSGKSDQVDRSGFTSNFLVGSDGTVSRASTRLSARLAQIGAMDIVAGRQREIRHADWRTFTSEILVAMHLRHDDYVALYSDNIVWRMGMRDTRVIGRPLLSVCGEMYFMLGMIWMPVVCFILYLAIFIEVHVMVTDRMSFFQKECYIVGLVFPITFTGTAFNLISDALSLIPLSALLLYLFSRQMVLHLGDWPKAAIQRISPTATLSRRAVARD